MKEEKILLVYDDGGCSECGNGIAYQFFTSEKSLISFINYEFKKPSMFEVISAFSNISGEIEIEEVKKVSGYKIKGK